MSVQFPSCPTSLKPIQHYLKTAAEHDQRDPVISYWCRLYALQCALKIDKKSDEAKVLLVRLMDWLETQKQALADNESITNDIAAQAHIENYALKLFVYADTQDRASNFGKNVVKAFYTSGMLFDVLQTFGELTEEIMQNRKYAKWKAAYIHNCLKNGETPIPGPIQDENNLEDDELGAVGGSSAEGGAGNSNTIGFYAPPPDQPSPYMPPPSISPNEPSSPSATPGASPYFPPSGFPSTPSGGVPTDLADLNSGFSSPNIAIPGSNSYPEGSSVALKPEQITKAQKYCKYAASALNYDDVPTAVNYLEKAMKLLKTGIDA